MLILYSVLNPQYLWTVLDASELIICIGKKVDFEAGSYYVVPAGLKFPLSQPPGRWCYRCEPP